MRDDRQASPATLARWPRTHSWREDHGPYGLVPNTIDDGEHWWWPKWDWEQWLWEQLYRASIKIDHTVIPPAVAVEIVHCRWCIASPGELCRDGTCRARVAEAHRWTDAKLPAWLAEHGDIFAL